MSANYYVINGCYGRETTLADDQIDGQSGFLHQKYIKLITVSTGLVTCVMYVPNFFTFDIDLCE